MIQEHCILTYNASVEDLIYYCFLGSALISLIMSIILGEFFTGKTSSLHYCTTAILMTSTVNHRDAFSTAERVFEHLVRVHGLLLVRIPRRAFLNEHHSAARRARERDLEYSQESSHDRDLLRDVPREKPTHQTQASGHRGLLQRVVDQDL